MGDVIKGSFADERVPIFYERVMDEIQKVAEELQLPRVLVVGILHKMTHDMLHEFTTIDSDMIDWN